MLALEAAGVVVLVAWQIGALITGDTDSVPSALALIVITALAAAALMAFSVATARGLSWGRSGGIVAQVLILAVAIGALTGIGADLGIAAAIAAPAVVGFVLLLWAVAQAAPPRSADDA
jgi:hypothetical protein